MVKTSQYIEDSSASTSDLAIDLNAIREHPVVSLKNISGQEIGLTEQPGMEAIKKSVTDFYETIVAHLTEEQLMEMVEPKDAQDAKNNTENLRSLLYTAALVRAGVDISKMSVGELTKDEIYAVEHGTKNTEGVNSTHHLLRSSFAKAAMERLTQAKHSGDHHAEEALKELQRLQSTGKTDDKYWKIIGMMPEQFAVKVATINNLRKQDMFVTKLREDEPKNIWPDARKQTVQKNLNLSEDQMYLVTTYRLHMLS